MRQPAHGGNLAWAAALAGCLPNAILDFSASISPLGPPNSAIAAIQSQIGNIKHYPDPSYSELRLALSHFHQLPSEWILPGNGSAELLTLAGRELAELAATILITPAFGDYYRTLTAYNAKVLEFPLDLGVKSDPLQSTTLQRQRYSEPAPQEDQPCVDDERVFELVDAQRTALQARVASSVFLTQATGVASTSVDTSQGKSPSKGSAVGESAQLRSQSRCLDDLSFFLDEEQQTNELGLLLNNPHNPTGKLFSCESILPYLEQFALVVVDEAFMDFVPPDEEQSLISLVQEYTNLVILRSLTKFYSLPGLRLGYAIAHPERLAKWQLWRDPWPVNTLAAAAAIAALQDQEFQKQTWAWLPSARGQLFEGLSTIPGLQPWQSAVNFLLVESQQSTSQLQQQLLQHYQILIRDCLSFQELGDRFFRVAVRSESDNQRLLTALESVVSAEYY